MQFRLTSALSHLDRRCDGSTCHKPLKGAWAYNCEQCQLDLCAACAPEGVSPEAAPPLARVAAKRGRAQPARARQRPAGKRGGAPRRGRGVSSIVAPCSIPTTTPGRATPRTMATLTHPGIHIGQPARGQRSRKLRWSCAGTRRKSTLLPKKRLARPMERDRGANAAGRPLYVRAARGCDRASTACCRPPPFTPPGTRCPSVCVCAVCALHGVSPRDRWSCVLPRGQMNVNVNVNVNISIQKSAIINGLRNRIAGAPAVPHCEITVGSRRTGCSNSHRFSSPAVPRFGCSLLLCVSFHC